MEKNNKPEKDATTKATKIKDFKIDNFEKLMSEFKQITDKLEDENLSLDEASKLFEKGINLLSECYAKLNETKGKISVLKQQLEKIYEEDCSDF